MSLLFRKLVRGWSVAIALVGAGFACSSGGLDSPEAGASAPIAVETAALTSCTGAGGCSGGQSCCNGFCRNLIALGPNDTLEYGCYAAQPGDHLGTPPADNKVPDYSFAGYKMGGVKIPDATFGIAVHPSGTGADDSLAIQAGISWCTNRGQLCVVQLDAALYNVDRPIVINASNVVLRGKTVGGTTTGLLSRIPSAHALVSVRPDNRPTYPAEVSSSKGTISGRVPVGASQIVVSGGGPWTGCSASTPCDVAVVRTPNQAWVEDIHMDQVAEPWDETEFKVSHVRKVVAAAAVSGGTRLTLDVPMVDGIEPAYGGGYVAKIGSGGFIENSGVEDLSIAADFHDNAPQDCGVGEDGPVQCACKADGKACLQGSHCDRGGSCANEARTCDGLACTASSQCGGGTCEDNKCKNGSCRTCRCPCDDSANTPCTTSCPAGLECRSGVCRCPSASGTCANTGGKCLLKDGSWYAVRFDRAKNSWVRRVTVFDYGMSAVFLHDWSSYNTVEEVAHLWPQSPIRPDTGLPNSGHRYSFHQGSGVGNLFQRCFSRDSRHSFVTGARATGPHVWLDSVAVEANADQGPHFYWATGLLYDNIYVEDTPLAQSVFPDGTGVRVHNAKNGGTSHGWTGAQVMIWNSEALLVADAPAGGMNWVVGGIGVKNQSTSSPEEPFGIWQFSSTTVKPRSLYLQQLKARLGQAALNDVTTPQQRNGRLTKALLKWKGLGKLSDFQDDPTCASGTPDASSAACCPKSCANCGGSGLPQECRAGPILSGTRSCLEVGPPCFRPDPTCRWGLASATHCCPSTCSRCGGSNLPAECRTGNVTRSCAEFPATCKLVDPDCDSGVIAATSSQDTTPAFCCSSDCTQCGGTGCSSAGSACCTQSITNSCDASMPACAID